MSKIKIEDREDLTCLALCYLYGDGVPRSRSKAVEILSAAGELGSSRAMMNLAIIYNVGHKSNQEEDASPVIEQDLPKAAYWFEKCANEGNSYAQHSIGYAYNHGYGVDTDYDKAAYWYLKAAHSGFIPAQRDLGKMLLNCSDKQEDREAALYWLERSYNKGKATNTTQPA